MLNEKKKSVDLCCFKFGEIKKKNSRVVTNHVNFLKIQKKKM